MARSLYEVTASTVDGIKVGVYLTDKGVRLVRHWEFVDFETSKTSSAAGKRVARLCQRCHDEFSRGTRLDHDGDCGPDVPAASASLGGAT